MKDQLSLASIVSPSASFTPDEPAASKRLRYHRVRPANRADRGLLAGDGGQRRLNDPFSSAGVAMASEREKMLAGELYDPLDSELVEARVHARDLCQELNASREADEVARRRILTKLLGAGGETAWIQPPFYCDYGSNILLGARVFFNFNCVVLDVCNITIGDFAMFGPAVQIYTPMHPMNAELRRRQEFGMPVTIGPDVWVGGGAIICPGVTIGARSVIGAGSVVTREIPEGVFAAGNPCRVIRAIAE